MTENQLIEENIGLIKSIVKKMRPKNSYEYDEFVQLGKIGLLNAIRKLDVKRGKLTTIAWYNIRHKILSYILKEKQYKNRNTALPYTCSNLGNIDPSMLWEILPDNLSDMERTMVQLRAEGHTLEEMGKLNKISRCKATKIYNTAIEKIKLANV